MKNGSTYFNIFAVFDHFTKRKILETVDPAQQDVFTRGGGYVTRRRGTAGTK